MRKISESTVRRLSLYLRFLEQFAVQGKATISSAELARRGGTTSAQVRKDLSFFGAGRIGGALIQYPGFRQRGFHVTAIYDKDPKKVGSRWNGLVVRDIRHIEADLA